MKRIIVNFLSLIVVLVVSQAQNISQYEYWLDDNHSERYLVNSSDKDIAFNISTASLNEGVHSLNFRAYRSDGVWGDFNRYLFYIASNSRSGGEITEYEYWIDNATNKIIGTDVKSDYDFNIDVSNLTNGKHIFCFRVKNTSGEWSNIYFEEFEIKNGVLPILPSLTISSNGNGAVTYNGTSVRNQSSSFSVDEGSDATISFVPDDGYRIKSVKVNSSDVTSNVTNNTYTISSIKENMTVEVEFEAIPIPTYTLSVKATGNGSASYDGTIARNDTKIFTLNGGFSATITFSPDNGYRIKNVKVNSTDVTLSVANNQYTVSNIKVNTTVEVEFEAIPIPTYTLSIKVTGNGYATYDGTTAKNNTKTFTVNEGANVTITFSPDNGYRIKSVTVNNSDVTTKVSNNGYTISNISANTTIEVEFEKNDDTTVSGPCGDNVYYSYDKTTHTLTISGEGEMMSWALIEQDMRPWRSYLNDIQSVIIKSGVTVIGCWAFSECKNLTSVTIPNSVMVIEGFSFQNCSSLASVTIPNSVTSIGSFSFTGGGAFSGCSSLTSLTIPSSVTGIAYETFSGCSNLSSIDFPNSVTRIGEDAFSNTAWYNNQPDGIVYAGMFAYKYKGEMPANTQIIIIDGTMGIADEAFMRCSNLISITIPNSVKSIGSWAFRECGGLTTIVSEIENPFEISSWTFSDDTYNVATLVVPRGTKAAYQATEGWNRFTKIVEAGGIEDVFEVNGIYYKIGENNTVAVTEGNTNFSGDVVIPSQVIYEGKTYSVTSIGSFAFEDCGLTSVTIPNSVISIGNGAFYRCSLKSITIPGSVTSIGDQAFYDCVVLTSVTIPNSVTSIGDKAFGMCNSLTTIVSELAKPFVINTSVFDFYDQNYRTLIVPKGTKSAYQATEGWNQFTNIVEAGEAEPVQPGQIHINDIFYKVTESGEAEVVSVDNGVTSITIPSTVLYNNTSYKVTAIAKDAFENCDHLSAVIWEPDAQFNAKVNNPNFLLYVSDEKYASRSVKNVVVNGVAESIELTDAANGNDFYCPKTFKARNIIYSHNYQMETGIGDSRGWETIVLPFDVQKYTHATKGELESFTTWSKGSNKKPFWLFELTAFGYKDVAGIKANTPYIISMPNNQQYEQQYQIPGVVTFSASDVEVKKSDNLIPANYQGKTFVPNYTNQNKLDFLALNVSNNYVTNPSKDIAGSRFIRGLRAVHPFEAYMTTTDNTRSIDVMEGMTTVIRGIQMVKDGASVIKVYDTRGVLLKTVTNMDNVRNGLKAGVYIVNGKKMVIK